ncbi:MAG: recA [Actinomycetia bacterium]|nr:recA [Actinomycetes bacterium]
MTSASMRKLSSFAEAQAKKYGEERTRNRYPPVIVPTGSWALDWALRYGGWRRGQVYEILGNKDAGKSTLALASLIQHRLMFPDLGVGYVGMENTFDPVRARRMGLDCSDRAKAEGAWAPRLPDHSEDVSDMTRDLVNSGYMSCVVVDSVGAMDSDKIMGKSAEDAAKQVGINAKIISQMTKALATFARNNQCTLILINQPRAPIGTMSMQDQSSGPKLLQHATTSKIVMRPLGGDEDVRKLQLDGEDEPLKVSIKSRALVERLKDGLPGRVAEFYVNRVGTPEYGPPGIDNADECISLGVRQKAIEQKGGWYVLPDGTQVQGRIKLATAIRERPELQKMIRAAIPFEDINDAELLEDDLATDTR